MSGHTAGRVKDSVGVPEGAVPKRPGKTLRNPGRSPRGVEAGVAFKTEWYIQWWFVFVYTAAVAIIASYA
eukprot:555443-Lingulodinium_polyedra.AAC.1